jgi:hypothetical protein
MADDNVTPLAAHRRSTARMALMMMLPKEQPPGPFTVTISDASGKMFEAVFPDHTGDLPPTASILGTASCSDLAVNLLAGALRAFAGVV